MLGTLEVDLVPPANAARRAQSPGLAQTGFRPGGFGGVPVSQAGRRGPGQGFGSVTDGLGLDPGFHSHCPISRPPQLLPGLTWAEAAGHLHTP